MSGGGASGIERCGLHDPTEAGLKASGFVQESNPTTKGYVMKKEPELTPWFDGEVKPARVGVYQRRTYGDYFAYWFFDGSVWLTGGTSTPDVARCGSKHSPEQDREWRGLTSKASA